MAPSGDFSPRRACQAIADPVRSAPGAPRAVAASAKAACDATPSATGTRPFALASAASPARATLGAPAPNQIHPNPQRQRQRQRSQRRHRWPMSSPLHRRRVHRRLLPGVPRPRSERARAFRVAPGRMEPRASDDGFLGVRRIRQSHRSPWRENSAVGCKVVFRHREPLLGARSGASPAGVFLWLSPGVFLWLSLREDETLARRGA